MKTLSFICAALFAAVVVLALSMLEYRKALAAREQSGAYVITNVVGTPDEPYVSITLCDKDGKSLTYKLAM